MGSSLRAPSGTRVIDVSGATIIPGLVSIYTECPPTSNNIPIKPYDDELHAVRRYKNRGANSLKQFRQPRRIQRQ